MSGVEVLRSNSNAWWVENQLPVIVGGGVAVCNLRKRFSTLAREHAANSTLYFATAPTAAAVPATSSTTAASAAALYCTTAATAIVSAAAATAFAATTFADAPYLRVELYL